MNSVRTITLFAPPPASASGGSSAWTVSLLVHVGICSWLFYGLTHTPHLQGQSIHQHFTVRVLNAPMTAPEVREYAAKGGPTHPVPNPAASGAAGETAPTTPAAPPAPPQQEPPAPAPAPAPALPAAIQLAQATHQQQTLIQPDAPPDMVLQKPTPVPLVLMWSSRTIPNQPIAPPPTPAIANLHSTIQRPNRELAPAEVNLSSTAFQSTLPMPAPGTTSPVTVRAVEAIKQMPTVATQTLNEGAAARILSLSDRQMQEGPVAVPLANASAPPSPSQSLTAGKAATDGSTGSATSTGKQPSPAAGTAATNSAHLGAGSNSLPATAKNQPGSTGKAPGTSPSSQITAHAATSGTTPGSVGSGPSRASTGAGNLASGNPAPANALPDGPGIGTLDPATVKRIVLRKDGQFGVVVVGSSSLADDYPETAAIWAGRLVYTVYLHVGPGKSWILQYSLPPGTPAAASGLRPDAPWPYDIVVPRLDSADTNDSAVMLHGFVDLSGRFDHLALVLPQNFSQAKFVLAALQQWQFRAARQNGQATPVEILLIIPDQAE